MKLFSNTCAKRNTAYWVLLLWLFALVSGFANACLLEAPESHTHVATAGSSETARAHAALAHHEGALAGHGNDSDISKAPCLKVCDDGAHSLPTQRSGVDQTDPGMAPAIAVLWTLPALVVPASHRMDELQSPVPGPPFRVRYSRLTL